MADSLDHLSSGQTQIEWLSSLNTEFKPKTNYRRTSIICTIGEYTLPPLYSLPSSMLAMGRGTLLINRKTRPED